MFFSCSLAAAGCILLLFRCLNRVDLFFFHFVWIFRCCCLVAATCQLSISACSIWPFFVFFTIFSTKYRTIILFSLLLYHEIFIVYVFCFFHCSMPVCTAMWRGKFCTRCNNNHQKVHFILFATCWWVGFVLSSSLSSLYSIVVAATAIPIKHGSTCSSVLSFFCCYSDFSLRLRLPFRFVHILRNRNFFT